MLLCGVVATCCQVAHVPLLLRSVVWSLMCLVVAGNCCVLRFDVCVAVCRCMCNRLLLLLLVVVASCCCMLLMLVSLLLYGAAVVTDRAL